MPTQQQIPDLAGLIKIGSDLMALAPDIERVGNLQALEREVKSRIDRLKTDEAAILASLRTKAQSEIAEGKAAEIIAQASTEPSKSETRPSRKR